MDGALTFTCVCVDISQPSRTCTCQGFIWAKIFEGETEGKIGLMGHLGDLRGWVWERDVFSPVRSAESLSISSYQSSQKAT